MGHEHHFYSVEEGPMKSRTHTCTYTKPMTIPLQACSLLDDVTINITLGSNQTQTEGNLGAGEVFGGKSNPREVIFILHERSR